jgi:hypothetical protein
MIPNIFHFIYLGFTPFSYIHYLSILTCKYINNPDTINLYTHYTIKNNTEWWYKIQKIVNIVYVEIPNDIFGNKIEKYQHMSDIIRLEKLIEYGGIYLDLDVICVRPLYILFKNKCVLGIQCPNTEYEGLCNAVILAEKNSVFLNKWLYEYHNFDKSKWDYHSVKLPLKLSKVYPNEIKILENKFFFPFDWNHTEFCISRRLDYTMTHCFTFHLWESLWDKTILKNANPLLLTKNTTFSKIIKKIIESYNNQIDKNKLIIKTFKKK